MTALEQYRPQPAELAVTDPTGGRLVAWAGAATAAHQLATSLTRTSFVPKAFQGNAGDATAAIILGDELGLSPLSALRSIYIISGTPALYARTMVALAMSHGHEVWTESSTDREVVVCGRRRGSEHTERVVWTIDRARKAGYTNNKKYESDPQAMLWAKAAGEVARKIAPDVLAGVPHSVEDLELEDQPTAKVARAPRTVQRQAKPETPEPDFDEPSAPGYPGTNGAPAPGYPDTEPVKAPPAERADEPITPAQLKKLHASLGDAGLSDRDAGLAFISQAVGRDVDTSKDLSKAEASQVIERLAEPAEPTLDGAL